MFEFTTPGMPVPFGMILARYQITLLFFRLNIRVSKLKRKRFIGVWSHMVIGLLVHLHPGSTFIPRSEALSKTFCNFNLSEEPRILGIKKGSLEKAALPNLGRL